MNTKKGIELEDIISSLQAVNGMLSILWEAVDGNSAVCDSVYGIREYLGNTIDRLSAFQRELMEEVKA